MDFSGDNLVLTGNGDYVDEFEKNNGGFSQVAVASDDRGDMQQNFFDVIRKGGQLNCDVDLGAATMVAIKMAVESYRQNKMMVWDVEKGEVKEG